MSNITNSALPNPLTPLAFLPPDVARQVTIASYIMVSTLSIMIWEMLNNVSIDVKMLKSGFSIPLAAYFLSRFTMLAFLIGVVVINTAPIGNCANVVKLVWLHPVQIFFTTLLFFLRVRATYQNSRWITIFFGLMWLATTGSSITDVFYHNVNIGPTNYCIVKDPPQYNEVAAILPLLNDTFVCVAITLKLAGLSFRGSQEGKIWFQTPVKGDYIPAFSRAVLRDGQAYYMTTAFLYLFFFIAFHLKPIPEPIRETIGLPCSTIINILACRVYRNGKSGVYTRTSEENPSLPTIHFTEATKTRPTPRVSFPPAVGINSVESTNSNRSIENNLHQIDSHKINLGDKKSDIV